MTNFPAGFTDLPTLDSNDVFLLDQKRKATGAAVKALGMPTGAKDAADYNTVAGALLESADATTGWTKFGNGTALGVDTSIKTQGTGSVTNTIRIDGATASYTYYTFPVAVSTAGRSFIAIDLYWSTDGGPSFTNQPSYMEIVVADSTALTGNVVRFPYPSVPALSWVTAYIPVDTITSVKSIGVNRIIRNDVGVNTRIKVWYDNIRWPNGTAIDAALVSDATPAVWVPPNYTPSADQVAHYLPAGKAVIDPAKGVYSKQNNVIWIHDYLAHVVGGETGETDVSMVISRLIDQAEPGQVVRATPGAIYRFDRALNILNPYVELDMTGAIVMLTYITNAAFCTIETNHVTIRGGWWLGYGGRVANGSTLTTVVGSPANNGTVKELDALDEEVRNPYHLNWAQPSHYARHLPQQLGLASDGGSPRCYVEFSMKDSAQVAGDCMIQMKDTSGTVLASSTVTLTASYATYRISYEPPGLPDRIDVTVKKVTATTNTISIATITPYGENEYSSTYDIASGFRIQNSNYIAFRDGPIIEGFGGDAIQCSNANTHHVYADDPKSYFCRRQGFSFNNGSHYFINNPVVFGCGQSAFDLEPFSSDWSCSKVHITDAYCDEVVHYGIATTNWARNFDHVIDGFTMGRSGIGLMYGGAVRGVYSNFKQLGTGTDFRIMGQDMIFENFVCRGKFTCAADTSTYNDGSGVVTFTPANNVIRNVSFTVGTYGIPRFQASAGYRLDGCHLDNTVVANYSGGSISAWPGPFLAPADGFSNVHFGEAGRQLSDTFKGIASSSVWVPGGFDHLADPVFNVKSFSGTSTRANNLGQRNVSVAASATSKVVTFPTQTVGVFSQAATFASNATAGTLTPSTTYYYRLAPRSRYCGPTTYQTQVTAATSGGHSAMSVLVKGALDATNHRFVEGFTLLRGLSNGGPYTTRYDVTPSVTPAGLISQTATFVDLGSSLTTDIDLLAASNDLSRDVYATSFAASTGSWDGATNESGYEPDANYTVTVIPSWITAWRVTNKTTAGFTIEFGTAAGASDTIDYRIDRLST